MTAAVALQAVASPLPLPRGFDPTLARLAGWAELAREADAARREAGADFVAAEDYGLAAMLALHLPAGVQVIAVGERWTFFDRPIPAAGRTGLVLRSLRRGAGSPVWPDEEPRGELVRGRGGQEAERYRLLRVRTPPGSVPTAEMPRPR